MKNEMIHKKSKKILFIIKVFITLYSILIVGCAEGIFLGYDINLVSIDKSPLKGKNEDVPRAITTYKKNVNLYSDNIIDASFLFTNNNILFSIHNKTTQTMIFIWNESVFIDTNNTAIRLIHSGTKYSDRYKDIPIGVIPKKTKIKDIVIPSNRISWENSNNETYDDLILFSKNIPSYGKWENTGIFPWYTFVLCPASRKDKQEFLNFGKKYIGSKIGLFFPIEINKMRYEYLFWFQVLNVYID